jgi:hypothetical protein
MTFDDLIGRIQAISANYGFKEEHLIKVCVISLTNHLSAAERWVRLEYEPDRSASLWLREQERDKLLAALRGQKGSEIRLIRQALEELFR